MTRRRAEYKWNFAIGTTSRVPNSNLHYLIADFDNGLDYPSLKRLEPVLPHNLFIQKTTHGWHLYTDLKMSFHELILKLHKIGADKKWIEIGQKRGYLFLADKSSTIFPWPVERMVIYVEKEK